MLADIDWNSSSREQRQDQAGKARTTAVYSKSRNTSREQRQDQAGKARTTAVYSKRRNTSREQRQDQAGKMSTTAVYSKRRKTFVLRSYYKHTKTDFVATLRQRACQVHKDNLPDFACPALPVNVARVPKPRKAELDGRYSSRFDRWMTEKRIMYEDIQYYMYLITCVQMN